MPNYNDSDHIHLSLKAICEQSFLPTEVIVVDDGSTDNSVEIIRELSSTYPFIKLVCNEVNRGVNYSTNKGSALATGDYIGFASANDLILPGFFEKSMRLLEKHPEAGLSWTDGRVIVVESNTAIEYSLLSYLPSGYYLPKELAHIASKKNVLVSPGGPSTIYKRDLISKSGPFLDELGPWGDWFLGQVMAFRYGGCYIPEYLVAVRRTEQNYSDIISSNPQLYHQLSMNMLQLLSSPEYSDVAPLIIRSRSLRTIQLSNRTPPKVFQALRKVKTRQAHSLIHHLIMEYIVYDHTRYVRENTWRTCRNTVISSGHLLKNIYDRAFAVGFHLYDQIRCALRERKI